MNVSFASRTCYYLSTHHPEFPLIIQPDFDPLAELILRNEWYQQIQNKQITTYVFLVEKKEKKKTLTSICKKKKKEDVSRYI